MRRLSLPYALIALIFSFLFSAANPAAVSAATIHHYEYVLTSGFIYVYDMDNGGKLVKRVSVPTNAGVRGAVASAATGMLYISYGSDGNSGGFQLAYNLATDQVAWTMSYSHGIDSMSVSPDGKKLYMPSGELSSGGTWYVEDTSTGNDIGTIDSGGTGPHNTIVSPNGAHVYMGNRDFNLPSSSPGVDDFDIADTSTNQVIGRVSPLKSGARPFTINSAETFSFNTVTAFLGFQVGDLKAGTVLYTVAVDGSHIPGYTTQTSATIPSHGISLSPDNKEIYLVDQPNSYVHVFDVTGLPGNPPVQVADIPLLNPMSGNQAECAYDCLRDGWVQHSRDGRFILVGDSGDVIDTLTRTTVATLPALANSRVEIEIDFQDSTPIWAATSRSGVGYANPAPPTFTARITSPALGSTVSGSNLAVTTSVTDTATITSVDLSVDGALVSTTTSSPYTFSWDTTKVANGSHTVTITASDASGNNTSFSTTFTVNNVNTPKPPSITTNSLPGGTQNVAYNSTLTATGGTTPYNWSLASGALPTGLALNASTGAISGTPTGSGTSNFTAQVRDANSQTATKSLSLTITAAPPPTSPSITTSSLPGATQKVAYSASLVASGGKPPYSWSIASGALPAGLTLNASTGAISGTPTGSGSSTFTVQVTDANSQTATKSLSVTVTAAPPPVSSPSISTSSLPGGTQNIAYTAGLAATGGTPPYTWSIVSGSLPAGLTLASSTGAISGTPTGSGTSNFAVRVTDSKSQVATKSFSIAISAAPVITSPSITTSSLPGGTQNITYNAVLAATGGKSPYSWSIVSGALPAGLALNAGSGAISGTPSGNGTSNFTVRVTDANSQSATKSLSLAVTAAPPTVTPPSITTSSLPGGRQNAAYSTTLAATSGTPPYSWAVASGSLPTGLALAANTGVISGTPTGSGTSKFTARVTDSKSQSATKSFTLTVALAGSPSIAATGGTPQSATVSAAFGSPLTAMVRDGSGNPLAGVTVTFTAPPQTGSSGTFAGGGNTAKTNASGVATSATFTANAIPGGPYIVTATAAGVSQPADFSLTNDPKASGSVAVSAGSQQRALVTTPLASPLKVTVRDASGNPSAGVTVTFTAPFSGPSGTFPGSTLSATATTDATGVATSPTFTANGIGGGPYNVTASAAGTGAAAVFSLTNVDFELSPSISGVVQVSAQKPGSATLTLSTLPASSTLPDDVILTCTGPATMPTTACSVSPAKISAGSRSGATALVTVTTVSGSLMAAPPSQRPSQRTPYLPWAAATALLGLVAIYFAGGQKIAPMRGRTAVLALLLLGISSAGLMGCVGAVYSQTGPGSVTVTATSAGISKTTTVKINVQ